MNHLTLDTIDAPWNAKDEYNYEPSDEMIKNNIKAIVKFYLGIDYD